MQEKVDNRYETNEEECLATIEDYSLEQTSLENVTSPLVQTSQSVPGTGAMSYYIPPYFGNTYGAMASGHPEISNSTNDTLTPVHSHTMINKTQRTTSVSSDDSERSYQDENQSVFDSSTSKSPDETSFNDSPTNNSLVKQEKRKKNRTNYTPAQIKVLEKIFHEIPYPDSSKIEELSNELQISEAKLKIWFQNKRARWRQRCKKQQNNELTATPNRQLQMPQGMFPQFHPMLHGSSAQMFQYPYLYQGHLGMQSSATTGSPSTVYSPLQFPSATTGNPASCYSPLQNPSAAGSLATGYSPLQFPYAQQTISTPSKSSSPGSSIPSSENSSPNSSFSQSPHNLSDKSAQNSPLEQKNALNKAALSQLPNMMAPFSQFPFPYGMYQQYVC